jgi:hypothetical protein
MMGCQAVLSYEAKVPANYDANYLDGELIYWDNGIKFHYAYNSMTFKSSYYKEKPHRKARFYITLETDGSVSNISIGKCKFENKKLNYSCERDFSNEILEYNIITGNEKDLIKYEILFDDFVPEKLFDGLFGFNKLKDTEYEIEFTVNYEINNIKYETLLKGIFYCYYRSGPIWLWT